MDHLKNTFGNKDWLFQSQSKSVIQKEEPEAEKIDNMGFRKQTSFTRLRSYLQMLHPLTKRNKKSYRTPLAISKGNSPLRRQSPPISSSPTSSSAKLNPFIDTGHAMINQSEQKIEPLLPTLNSINQAKHLKNLRRRLNDRQKFVHSLILSNLNNELTHDREIKRIERAEQK